MKVNLLIGAIAALTLVGCAHATMRGSVAMKVSEDEGHVCLGDNEVKAGDRVVLFRNDCKRSGGGKTGGAEFCKKVETGEGTILQTLNEHYSVMKVDPGVAFNEGTIVEKKK